MPSSPRSLVIQVDHGEVDLHHGRGQLHELPPLGGGTGKVSLVLLGVSMQAYQQLPISFPGILKYLILERYLEHGTIIWKYEDMMVQQVLKPQSHHGCGNWA